MKKTVGFLTHDIQGISIINPRSISVDMVPALISREIPNFSNSKLVLRSINDLFYIYLVDPKERNINLGELLENGSIRFIEPKSNYEYLSLVTDSDRLFWKVYSLLIEEYFDKDLSYEEVRRNPFWKEFINDSNSIISVADVLNK